MSHQEVDTSFLVVPDDLLDFENRWEELTLGGVLWRKLLQLGSQGAADSIFEELRRHLDEWYTDISKGEEKGWLPHGKRQWETASKLLELAEKAAAQSRASAEPPIQDERLESTTSQGLEPWERDAFCAFRGEPRRDEHPVKLTALLIDGQTGTGFTADLTIERLKNGSGSIYPSPQEHAFLTLDKDFKNAINDAAAFVKKQVREQGFSFDSIDIRWSLKRHDAPLLPSPLSGPSIGGAFAMGLLKLMGGGIP